MDKINKMVVSFGLGIFLIFFASMSVELFDNYYISSILLISGILLFMVFPFIIYFEIFESDEPMTVKGEQL